MKLTNVQIDAIISKALENDRKLRAEDIENLKEDYKKEIDLKVLHFKKSIDKIPKFVTDFIFQSNFIWKKDIDVIKLYEDKLYSEIKSKIPVLNSCDLRNRIILASIDSVDLSELCSTLNISIQ